jgi:hypothetical protein
MEALRLMAKPINGRVIVELPPDMDADTVEIIVLANRKIQASKQRRNPPSQLAKTEIFDDLISPAANEADWDTLK